MTHKKKERIFMLSLPVDLHLKLKMISIKEGKYMNDLIVDWISQKVR